MHLHDLKKKIFIELYITKRITLKQMKKCP